MTAVYQLRPGLFKDKVVVASRGHFSDDGFVSVASRLFRDKVLVASRGHFSDDGSVSVASRLVQGKSTSCVPACSGTKY